MTSATVIADSIDFRAIAQEIVGGNLKTLEERELVPTEVRVRREREGKKFMRRPNILGATVDQEGLNNNYGVEPQMYYANFPSPEQAQAYLLQGAFASLLVTMTILTAFAVS